MIPHPDGHFSRAGRKLKAVPFACQRLCCAAQAI
jgi:hypothetical protein